VTLGAAIVAVMPALACEQPTEVTLVLTSDVPCATLSMNETSITLGSAADIETKLPVTVTGSCDPGTGTIGTFVVIPGSSNDASFAVRVVSGVDTPVGNCAAPDYTGCIVERRELTFIPHTPLTLPIAMDLDCVNVSCLPNTTCYRGACVSSMVPDPAACSGAAGCGPDELLRIDGGSGVSGDATTETSSADGPGPDAPADVSAGTSADATPDVDMPSRDSGGDAPGTADSGPLGTCPVAGSATGVVCAGGLCATGQVCCVTTTTTAAPTETCTSPSACNADGGTGLMSSSSFACRNAGDCPAGTTCCLGASGGFVTTCAASCSTSPTRRIACRNTCECGTLNCEQTTCGDAIGVCTTSVPVCP
jgi:hypothetical protein